MLRTAIAALRAIRPITLAHYNATRVINNECKRYFSLNLKGINNEGVNNSLVRNSTVLDICKNIQHTSIRTVTKFSLRKGKRKSVKAVVRRFFRLHWGGWIRTKAGRNKKLWKKTSQNKRRLRQHVLCNATQNTLLDNMVTKFWKKPKHYVDDPYAPYHTREEFFLTRKKPRDSY